ncbi:MAG: DUF3611 family protein [Paracoccaceae bacterium]|nr:DUF3611 family protein [Paracoccaceae bacterium]
MTAADISSTADRPDGLARAFLMLGRIGFWVQFVLLIAVVLLGIWTFSVTGAPAGAANILAFLGLALPLFTTFWCWRYAQLGRTLGGSGTPRAAPARAAWIGVWAGTAGVVVSVLSLFGAAFALVMVMLANPQVGIQISPATAGASAYTVSAVDALSILSLLLMLTAELLVVAISLRLVFLIASTARESGR